MSKKIQTIFLLLSLFVLSVSSQNNDTIVTVKSTDVPSDGTGIVGGSNRNTTSGNSTSSNSTYIDGSPETTGNTNNTSILSLSDNISRISSLAGFVYSWTVQPIFTLIWWLLSPIFSLVRGLLSPVLTIVNYLLGALGLPPLGDLLESLLKTLIGWLATILTNLASLVNGLFGPQPSTQPTRRRRSIAEDVMAPIIAPFRLMYEFVMLPFTIVEMMYNIFRMPFWVMSYPLSWSMSAAGMPVSMGYNMMTWPLRMVLSMIGLGGSDEPEVDEAFDDVTGNSTRNEENRDMMHDMMVSMGQGAQQALMEGMGEAFRILKDNILPALDSTAQTYQNSDIIPDNLKGYLRGFHQAYSMLHMLRIV